MGYRLAPQARSELIDIWRYIFHESANEEIADRLIDSIFDRFLLLSQNPYLGRSREELRPGLRSFPVGEYVIMYRVSGADVLILHIRHGRRDIQSWFT